MGKSGLCHKKKEGMHFDTPSFLAGMKKLKFLHFDDVIDGDISPLLDSSLEFVGMVSKKKYSHTEKEVNLILERNRLNNK